MFICWAEENLPGPQAENLIVQMRKLLFTFILLPLLSWADSVEVLDGSIIQGKIIGMVDGNLTIQTSFAGKIKVPYTKISSINSDKEISLRLTDNRTFDGIIDQTEDNSLTIRASEQSFSFSEIKHLWDADSTDPLILEAQKNALAMQMKWKHAIGFDLTGASGNAESFGLGIRLDSSLGNRMREYDFYLSYLKSTKKDVTIVDETKFGVDYDSRFFEELSWYAKVDLENDRLEEVDLRATSALGLKYSWIEATNYKTSVRAGAAFRFEELGSDSVENLSEPALDFGLEHSQKIKNFLGFESDLSFIPNIDDFSDYLFSKDTALVIAIDEKQDWKIRSGLAGTYNSTPVPGKEEMDLKYYLRVVYDFN
jgi:putative salt-induced outer membrane protein YdiY